jgi:hypothetical protein
LQISSGLQTTNDCCSQTCSLDTIFLQPTWFIQRLTCLLILLKGPYKLTCYFDAFSKEKRNLSEGIYRIYINSIKKFIYYLSLSTLRMGEAKFFLISPHHLQTSPFSPYSLKKQDFLCFFGDSLSIFFIGDKHDCPIRSDTRTNRFSDRGKIIQSLYLISIHNLDIGFVNSWLSP